MKLQRWHVVAAGAALAASVFALGKKWSGPPQVPDAGVATEPIARAPDDLLADIYLASPNASWSRLQRGVGGAVGILPATLPGLVVTLADLDRSLADELDGTAPIFGVLTGDPADPGVALTMKLVDPRRARRLLVDGEEAQFTAKDAAGMTLLVPNAARVRSIPSERSAGIAITPNGYLLVTRVPADLARLGPYVTRTLPSRPLPAESAAVIDMPKVALKTMLKTKLDALWEDAKSFLLTRDERMRAERGRAPDFGDPAAIVAAVDAILRDRVAVVGDLEKLHVVIDATDDALVFTATLTPASGAEGQARRWVDGMTVGDASPVLALPSVSALALSMRDSEAERAEQSKQLAAAIATTLGPRLQEPSILHDVVEAMTTARGDSFALALTVDEPTGVFVLAPVRDAVAADKAIQGAFAMTKAQPFKELFRVREVISATEELQGVGKISTLMVEREPTKPKRGADAGTPRPMAFAAPASTTARTGVAWSADQGVLSLGAGAEPLVTLKIGKGPDRKLVDEPALQRFVGAIGSHASTVMIGQPLRFDPKRANLPAAPLGIAIGRKGGDAFVHVDIADALLREAVRWQMGF